MKAFTRHSLVAATTLSGLAVLEKSASATPDQAEVLRNAWPQEGDGQTKLATLASVLATAQLVEEAAASA